MENSKDKKSKSKKKTGEVNRTLKGTTMSMKRQAISETTTSDSQRSSAKRTKRKSNVKDSNASSSSQDNNLEETQKTAIPPLPSILPPINMIHRDVMRAWSRELNLSTKGKKLELYKRICDHAYPNQMNIPDTAKEARILSGSQRKAKVNLGEITPESFAAVHPSRDTPHIKEEESPLEGPPPVHTGVNITPSTSEAVFDSWAKIAAMSGKAKEKLSAQKTHASADKWCVVHGRSFSANRKGWVHLQFHGGQVWVPDEQGQLYALFLIPSCTVPPSNLEDNMLCPKCVQKNKTLMRSLQHSHLCHQCSLAPLIAEADN